MHYPQLIIYETDNRLATWLREATALAEMLRYDEEGQPAARSLKKVPPSSKGSYGWLLREPRQPAACLRLLQRGGPVVLVIQLAKEATVELDLLEQTTRRYPDALTVVVGEEAHRSLSPLAWDLGATAVLLPPRVGERLQEIVLGLMRSATAQTLAGAGPPISDES